MKPYAPFYAYNINLYRLQGESVWSWSHQWPDDVPLVAWSFEYIHPVVVSELVHHIQRVKPHNPLWCLLHPQQSHVATPPQMPESVELAYVNMDRLCFYFEMYLYKSTRLNSRWNPQAKKFLYTMGKPDRPLRLRLMYELYAQGLLDHAEWSMYLDPTLRRTCRSIMPELTDAQYHDFLDRTVRTLDPIPAMLGAAGSFHYNAYPFDPDIFARTSFRLLNETMMHDEISLTEKTMITMANRQPFIMVGLPGTLAYLRAQGYRTFEQYLPCPDYDSETDDRRRINMIVENLRHWLSDINKYAADIACDLEHNYHVLMQHIRCDYESYHRIWQRFPGQDHIAKFLPLSQQRSYWINQYYSIKDDSWPDCWVEEHFEHLPQYIQDECRNVYNINPKTLAKNLDL
jgi:hypothetical protein